MRHKIAVNDGVLYGLAYDYYGAKLVKLSLSDYESGETITCTDDNLIVDYIDFNDVCKNYRELEITDMIYQDSFVYLLAKEFYFKYGDGISDYGFNSRGALIAVDVSENPLDTDRVTSVDWNDFYSDEDNLLTTFTFGRNNEGGNSYTLFGIDRETGNAIPLAISSGDIYTVSAQAQENNSLNGTRSVNTYLIHDAETGYAGPFCGPEKFIAVKPKKLVIADDGIAFYTDSDGLWCYKNVNRILTIDLESFALDGDIGMEAEQTDATFRTNMKDNLIFRGSAWDISTGSRPSTSSLYLSGSYSEYYGNYYPGIRCSDDQ